MIRRVLPVVLAASMALSGCVSLFPKAKPATLYRLAPVATAPAAAPAGARRVTILRGPIGFTRSSANDLIITTQGNETASIAGVRWATPVQLMFDEALTAAFDGNGAVNLIGRGSPVPADLILRIEVTRFEANYADGEGAAPTVQVAARLTFSALKDPTAFYETVVRAESKAADNRVGAIVDAYNAATGDLLGKIVSECERRGAQVKRT